jgi:predicted Zn-dependent protease with MMP-like domain
MHRAARSGPSRREFPVRVASWRHRHHASGSVSWNRGITTLGTAAHAVKQNLRVAYPVSADEFEQLVADVLDSIPPELAAAIQNVAVVVDDWPPPNSNLLGLYEGVPLTARGPIGYAGVMPDRITIFRGPLCARARDAADLAAQIRVTVLHEVGHHFGIDEARLRELGWG